MVFFKRIFLFLLVNILVMATISIVLNVLGVGPYLTARGMDYQSLAAFCLVWGMGGSFISLLMSKFMAKTMMGVRIIDPKTHDHHLSDLVQMVHNLARSAGLPKMPEVGIFDSPEPNAFATGATKSSSLVAVSTGLLDRMKREEVEGVIGHEVAHIANGDMVTLTLIQGVINAFVMFLSRALAFALSQRRSDDDSESSGFNGPMFYIMSFVFEIVFTIMGSMVVAWFSRFREFRADAGGAKLAGRDKMIAALERLKSVSGIQDPTHDAPAFKAMKISGSRGGLLALFSTHPPLEMRIQRLELMRE
ncbi:MAG: protease HtpX [Xanthomonadaceae bacterium]|nr:protease HtpX [Xanthomonadaceae bacterium]